MTQRTLTQEITRPKAAAGPAKRGLLQRACACGKHTHAGGGECEECKKKREQAMQTGALQRSATGTGPAAAPPIVHDVLRASGQPLDAAVRSFLGPRFGVDLSQVRVHTGARASESARAVDALAYTVGNHVVFGDGQYAPHTIAGRQLVAHELTHVIQQRAAGNTLPDEIAIGPVDDSYEREASRLAGQMSASGEGLTASRLAAPFLLQRQPAHRPGAVTYEKSGESVEASYRRAGLTQAANAVRNCREQGLCDHLLTEAEAWQWYQSGRSIGGLGPSNERPPQGAGGGVSLTGAAAAPVALGTVAAPSLGTAAPALGGGAAPGMSGGAAGATESALARAAARWGSAAVIEGGEVAAGGATATVGTVAIPIAVGVVLVVAIYSLVSYTSFQLELQRHGYFILPNILAVCISGCHQPAAPTPTFRDIPFPTTPGQFRPQPRPGESFSPDDVEILRRWLEESGPTATSTGPGPATTATGPTTAPAPTPTIEERRQRCEEIWNRYKALGACRSCNRNDTPAERAVKIACLEAVIRGRREYLTENCDDVLEGSIRRGSAVARRGHEIQVEQLERALANCKTLPTQPTP